MGLDIHVVKQCHNKPAMTGNGNHTTYKIVMTGAWFIIVLPTLMGYHGICSHRMWTSR